MSEGCNRQRNRKISDVTNLVHRAGEEKGLSWRYKEPIRCQSTQRHCGQRCSESSIQSCNGYGQEEGQVREMIAEGRIKGETDE